MQIELPRYTTTNSLARIAGTNHGRIGRLVLAGKIRPVAILEERGRDVFLYSPSDAGLLAALLDSTNTTDKQ